MATIFVDKQSVYSHRSLAELLKEAYSNQISFFEFGIGKYIKQWRHARSGDYVVYNLDNVAVCGADVTFIRSRAFRPLFLPDHNIYKMHIEFIKKMCCESFDDDWQEDMLQKHIDAIEQKKILFTVFAVVRPVLIYNSNKFILEERIREMEQADREVCDSVLCHLND